MALTERGPAEYSGTELAPDLPASGRIPALDGIRVIAAFAVLLTHVGGPTGVEFTGSPASWVVSRGDVGVPIFFVLSGLLLYRPWARADLRPAQAGLSGRTSGAGRCGSCLPTGLSSSSPCSR